MSYIGASDLVFNNKDGIYSGGFNVQSIMMKGGISPIMTINNGQNGGSVSKVSDLFQGLVVPAFAYHNNFQSGMQSGGKHNNYKKYESDDEDDVINDDLHDKLLNLMSEYDDKLKHKRKNTRKNSINKKNNTKKIKKIIQRK